MKMRRNQECDYITTQTQSYFTYFAVDFILCALAPTTDEMNEEGEETYIQNKHLKRGNESTISLIDGGK